MLPTILLYIVVFLYGIVIGSFLNVLIYRIPKKENIVTTRSHCMNCGYQLRWYDLVPLFSYLALGGRCRKCKAHISVQYPVIEALNGVLYLIVFWKYGMSVDSLVYCLLFSALLALSVIDFRTYEIPVGFNLFILALGLIHGVFHYEQWLDFLIGFLCVSVFLLILYYVTGGHLHRRRCLQPGRGPAGGLWTAARLEIDYCCIFTGMYHRFRDSSDPYESKRRRTCPRHGTVSFCGGGNRRPLGK